MMVFQSDTRVCEALLDLSTLECSLSFIYKRFKHHQVGGCSQYSRRSDTVPNYALAGVIVIRKNHSLSSINPLLHEGWTLVQSAQRREDET